jgi:hypothetical protein
VALLQAARIEELGPGDFVKVDLRRALPKAPTEFPAGIGIGRGLAWRPKPPACGAAFADGSFCVIGSGNSGIMEQIDPKFSDTSR